MSEKVDPVNVLATPPKLMRRLGPSVEEAIAKIMGKICALPAVVASPELFLHLSNSQYISDLSRTPLISDTGEFPVWDEMIGLIDRNTNVDPSVFSAVHAAINCVLALNFLHSDNREAAIWTLGDAKEAYGKAVGSGNMRDALSALRSSYKRARSNQSRFAAKRRKKILDIANIKLLVKAKWAEHIAINPAKWNKTRFARTIIDEHKEITDPETVMKWMRLWEKE